MIVCLPSILTTSSSETEKSYTSIYTKYFANITFPLTSILFEEIPLSEALSWAIIRCLISSFSSVNTNRLVYSKYSKTMFVTPNPTRLSFNSGYISYSSSLIPIFNI